MQVVLIAIYLFEVLSALTLSLTRSLADLVPVGWLSGAVVVLITILKYIPAVPSIK